jgi:hypothetical protein
MKITSFRLAWATYIKWVSGRPELHRKTEGVGGEIEMRERIDTLESIQTFIRRQGLITENHQST